MKKMFTLLLLICGSIASAQNADPYLSLSTNPSVIALGQTTTLEAIAGNVGNGTIVSNSMRITITVGSNAQIITSVDPMSRWFQQSLTAGPGNTLVLVNAGLFGFSAFDLNQVSVILQGVALGGPTAISGSIAYLPGNNINLGGAANSSQGNANFANDNSTTSITVTSALLVRLGAFAATSDACKVQLSWSTTSEENFKTFEVEQSLNGVVYTKLAAMAGTGTASSGASYKFAYEQNVSKAFYRLKMIDRDGSASFSKVITVNARCNEKTVMINPNPVLENQSVAVALTGYSGKVKGELFSVSGKLVASYVLQNGTNTLQLSNLLSKGTYQLRVTAETGEAGSYKIVLMK